MTQRESGQVTIGQSKVRFSIRRSKRRRRSIGLVVGREGDIQILAPWRAGFLAIERFLHTHTAWINRRINHANRRHQLNPLLRFENGEIVPYRGEKSVLRVMENAQKPQGCFITSNDIIVNLPHASSLPAERSEEVRLELMLWYKKQAKKVFDERITYWGGITHLKPRRFILSSARRQWGSCSAKNDVRLNWRLIMATPEMLDYVIVHELSHIPHKNHSRRFWRLVESYIPNCKAIRKRLHLLDPGFGFSKTSE